MLTIDGGPSIEVKGLLYWYTLSPAHCFCEAVLCIIGMLGTRCPMRMSSNSGLENILVGLSATSIPGRPRWGIVTSPTLQSCPWYLFYLFSQSFFLSNVYWIWWVVRKVEILFAVYRPRLWGSTHGPNWVLLMLALNVPKAPENVSSEQKRPISDLFRARTKKDGVGP